MHDCRLERRRGPEADADAEPIPAGGGATLLSAPVPPPVQSLSSAASDSPLGAGDVLRGGARRPLARRLGRHRSAVSLFVFF